MYHNAVYWINLKSAQDRGLIFWRTNSNTIILDDSVPAHCLQKVVNHKTGDILYQKIRLSSRPPPKVTLKSAWQVRYESTGKSVADQVTTRPEVEVSPKQRRIDCCIAKQHSVNAIQRGIKTHDSYTGKCRKLRSVPILFQNQCPHEMKYLMEGIVYCDCGTCLIPSQEA